MEGFGHGIWFAVLVGALVLIGGVLGAGFVITSSASDCTDFGKTKFRGAWYECKPLKK